jgi:hypothetical protein
MINSLPESLQDRISPEPMTGCWLWTGYQDEYGYGSGLSKRIFKTQLAHRVIYELLVGPIPKGLTIDHLCRVRCCVNPGHLEPVTHAVNMKRGIHGSKTHCKNGHEFSDDNTYVATRNHGTMRCCRECNKEARRRYVTRCKFKSTPIIASSHQVPTT